MIIVWPRVAFALELRRYGLLRSFGIFSDPTTMYTLSDLNIDLTKKRRKELAAEKAKAAKAAKKAKAKADKKAAKGGAEEEEEEEEEPAAEGDWQRLRLMNTGRLEDGAHISATATVTEKLLHQLVVQHCMPEPPPRTMAPTVAPPRWP